MTPPGTDVLVAHAVSKRFGSVRVFDDVSLRVAEGEVLGIVGPNGAGKSTLLSVLTGTVRADAGRIELLGEDVSSHAAADRCRRGLARSYQVPRPFLGLSVYENTLVAARFGAGRRGSEADRLALNALARAGLRDQGDRPAAALGLLDRKRLELAKALATEPRVLLLDELAGGLTDPEVQEVIAIVRGLREDGLGIVWIEHIVHALVAVVDRLVCLAAGTVLCEGRPRDVLANEAVRRVYLGGTAEALLESAA